jgi:hypothetical protein
MTGGHDYKDPAPGEDAHNFITRFLDVINKFECTDANRRIEIAAFER